MKNKKEDSKQIAAVYICGIAQIIAIKVISSIYIKSRFESYHTIMNNAITIICMIAIIFVLAYAFKKKKQ